MEVGEFYEYVGTDYPTGIYRAVGVKQQDSRERITLLRVSNDQHMRKHTGEIIHISDSEIDTFTQTVEPNKERFRVVKSKARAMPYVALTIFRRLRTNTFLSALSLGSVVAGFGADSANLALISTVLILLGSVGISVSVSNWYNHG